MRSRILASYKQPRKYTSTETVEEYLNRGGKITRGVPKKLPKDWYPVGVEEADEELERVERREVFYKNRKDKK